MESHAPHRLFLLANSVHKVYHSTWLVLSETFDCPCHTYCTGLVISTIRSKKKTVIFCSEQYLERKHQHAVAVGKRVPPHVKTMIACQVCHVILMPARVNALYPLTQCTGKSTHMHMNHFGPDSPLVLADGWLAAPELGHIAPFLDDRKSLSTVCVCGCLCVLEMRRKMAVHSLEWLSEDKANVMSGV